MSKVTVKSEADVTEKEQFEEALKKRSKWWGGGDSQLGPRRDIGPRLA